MASVFGNTLFRKLFGDLRMIRMSNGELTLVRDLGAVKGGRGLRVHEKILTLSLRRVVV